MLMCLHLRNTMLTVLMFAHIWILSALRDKVKRSELLIWYLESLCRSLHCSTLFMLRHIQTDVAVCHL